MSPLEWQVDSKKLEEVASNPPKTATVHINLLIGENILP